MALLPMKTYSRRNNELSVLIDKEKENVDPFDELLSSPLKQDVQFQPLSFWGKKVKQLESKEKSKKVNYGLFEPSDSDELNSPCLRKRKPNTKYAESSARTTQPKSRSLKLSDRKKNYSAYSWVRKCKDNAPVISNKSKTLMSTDGVRKYKACFLASNLHPSQTTEEKLRSTQKSCDASKFTNLKGHFKKARSVTHSNGNFSNISSSVRSKQNYEKKLNKSTEANFINSSSMKLKIFEDISTSELQLNRAEDETVIQNCREDFVNSVFHDSKNLDETLTPFHLDHHGLKFVSTRRHFYPPNYFNMPHENFDAHLNSVEQNNRHRSLSQLWKDPKKSVGAINVKCENVSIQEKFLEKIDNETISQSDDSSINTLTGSEKLDKILCVGNVSNEKSYEIPRDVNSKGGFLEVDETLGQYYDSSINTLTGNERLDKTLCIGNVSSEESNEISGLKYQGENTLSDDFEFLCLNDTELEDLSQELKTEILLNGAASESSSTSDDTLSSCNDEDTVINIGLKAEANDLPLTGFYTEKPDTQPVLNDVSVLTTKISDLSISNAIGSGLPQPEVEKIVNYESDPNYEDKEKNSFAVDLRNVTTKKRGLQNRGREKNSFNRRRRGSPKVQQKEKDTPGEPEFGQTIWTPGRTSLDWNKSICFANPVFESTRVLDISLPDVKRQSDPFENSDSILEKTLSGFDRTYVLKPGKKWQRSMSVLKQIQRGSTAGGRFESTRLTGRKFDSFLQDILEIQNAEKSGFFTSLADISASNKSKIGASNNNIHFTHLSKCTTVLESENSSLDKSEKFNIDDSVFSKTVPNVTLPEKSSLNHTVKVIQPEESPSAFRSALGLDADRSSLKEDSAQEKSSTISARDFILLQCRQEDVLSFEEYFNETTLENCRKIGEGVYGEVFMSASSVIKIIPIEGSDKVNGEPQKTFEEIISEVIIASKLSNLRKGEKHRTEGFSEMKRCWCVKGKYPEYLLKLWNEFDQLGSGSENDSPVMFKDDQLYMILELANGGKDLESFVFSSSAQCLSVFIQIHTLQRVQNKLPMTQKDFEFTTSVSAAFSLAAAEKAFEFEHRDLHWGNVLISETKEKFMSIFLDGVEHKIPTKGVKVCIIDFTLSRINHEGCCIFNDLSIDPSLFASEGDYQFDIYRLMLREVKNDWSLFRPKTNIFWLHYTLDKMLKMVRYKNKKAKIHVKHLRDVKILESVVLEHNDSTDFVLSNILNEVIKKL